MHSNHWEVEFDPVLHTKLELLIKRLLFTIRAISEQGENVWNFHLIDRMNFDGNWFKWTASWLQSPIQPHEDFSNSEVQLEKYRQLPSTKAFTQERHFQKSIQMIWIKLLRRRFNSLADKVFKVFKVFQSIQCKQIKLSKGSNASKRRRLLSICFRSVESSMKINMERTA